jgi:hypothetical protein
LAFHFRYIMPGEWLDSREVAVLLFARVLRAVGPDFKKTGSLLFRIGPLIYTSELDGPLVNALRNSHTAAAEWRFCRGQQHKLTEYVVPLDRTFVVTVSGRVLELQNQWGKRLQRYVRHPFLCSLAVDIDDPAQELTYLRQCHVVGELRLARHLVLEYESIEFEPELSTMLCRLGFQGEASVAFSTTALELFKKI